MYVNDCVEGVHHLMRSDFPGPLNLGTDPLVTIDELVDIIAKAPGEEITTEHDLTNPQGVRGRNSDNCLLGEMLGWQSEVSLQEGMDKTYAADRGTGGGGGEQEARGEPVRTAAAI